MLISPENWNQTALLVFIDMASQTCFLRRLYLWNQCCLLTAPASSRTLCASIQSNQYSWPPLPLLAGETGACWSSQCFFFPSFSRIPASSVSSSPLPRPTNKEGKTEHWEKADLTTTGTICQTIWLLSSPDRRQEWGVRKSRELGIQRAGSSLGSAISSTCDLARPQFLGTSVSLDLSFSRDLLEPYAYVSMRSESLWVAVLKQGLKPQCL